MRKAEKILGIIHERGKQGLPLEDVYRQLYNPDLYLRAYARLSTNNGAMTAGANGETIDGMSLWKIDNIIAQLRNETYQMDSGQANLHPEEKRKEASARHSVVERQTAARGGAFDSRSLL